jgi:diguanylate cyclase
MARRLFVLFVAAALLPLALSDWLALSTVTRIADELQQRAHADRTREVSRQVLARLVAARDVLMTLPDPGDTGLQASATRLPGLGSTFTRIEGYDTLGRPLVSAVTSAAPAARPEPAPSPRHALEPSRHTLVIDRESGTAPRILLERHVDGRLAWRAELAPQTLWHPVLEGAGDTRWQVLDAQGRTLLMNDPGEELGQAPRLARVSLPLDGLFEGGSWQFQHEAPRAGIQVLGSPLASWLALLAVGTVFSVAFLAHWRIRKVFRPLEALTESTRRLAAGDTSARVAVSANHHAADELAELAGSFNDMAARIDEQLGALRELAAIDHDMLRGAPMELVCRRLMAQLLRAVPNARVRVSWRDCAAPDAVGGEPCVHTVCSQQPSGAPALAAKALPDLAALASQDGADGTWWPELPEAGWVRVWRAVSRDGQVGGLIALALPPGTGVPDQLDALRDRLAVALAARRRDRDMAWRATHDSLTGLLNRLGLQELLDRAWPAEGPPQESGSLALLLIDLDHFKDINDTRGHDVGDALLRQVAERLQQAVPPAGTVARLGGDEFVVLLPGATAEEALAVATDICAQLRLPFTVAGIVALVGASAGIAMAPAHGHTRQELTRKADIALYTAKAQRGSVRLFHPSQDQEAAERAVWVAELRDAITKGQFLLHYQPRVGAVDGRLRSVEALVRWQHPRLGLQPPGRFIPVAEQAGLMGDLGDIVLDQACRQIAAWQKSGVPVHKVSVNVSMQQLLTGRLPATVRDTLSRHAVSPEHLELEVTESLLADDAESAQLQLRELRALGIEIALDDFGTGYSAMSQLRRLPIDVMKIDRSFVVDLDSDDGALAIARAIVALAGALGLRVVAEGVESAAHARRLRELGCDELQGYFFAKPMPAEELPAFLNTQPVREEEAHAMALGS